MHCEYKDKDGLKGGRKGRDKAGKHECKKAGKAEQLLNNRTRGITGRNKYSS